MASGQNINIFLDCEFSGYNEVIQIGAVRCGPDLRQESTFLKNCRPRRPISRMVTEITGLTNEMLAGEPPFEKVFADFIRWASKGGGTVRVFTWDTEDSIVLARQCGELRLPFPDWLEFAADIQAELSICLHGSMQNRISLGDAGTAYGMEWSGRQHNALADAMMTADVTRFHLYDPAAAERENAFRTVWVAEHEARLAEKRAQQKEKDDAKILAYKDKVPEMDPEQLRAEIARLKARIKVLKKQRSEGRISDADNRQIYRLQARQTETLYMLRAYNRFSDKNGEKKRLKALATAQSDRLAELRRFRRTRPLNEEEQLEYHTLGAEYRRTTARLAHLYEQTRDQKAEEE